MNPPPPRSIELIVIHCSATRNGDSLFRYGPGDRNPSETAATVIDKMHRDRGFQRSARWLKWQNPHLPAIGYHFVITCNGAVFSGRHPNEVGAHVRGLNSHSIGVCLTGTDAYTQAQWETLAANISGLRKTYPAARVVGHRDLFPDLDGDGVVEAHEWLKTCPGFSVADWLADGMRPVAGHVIAEGAP